MQVIKGLSRLLSKAQRAIDGNQRKVVSHVASLSTFVQSLQAGEHATSATGSEQIQRLTRFLSSEAVFAVTRTDDEVELTSTERAQTQDVIASFIDCVIPVADANPQSQEQEQFLLKLVEAAGHLEFVHVAVILLFNHARGSATLSETFSVESVALKFARSVLVRSIAEVESLAPL